MSFKTLMDNRRVRYWLRRAQSSRRKENREKAWDRALDAAERAEEWMVVDCGGKRLGGRHPIKITRIAKMGTIYGRKHQLNGKVGAERAWGRTR